MTAVLAGQTIPGGGQTCDQAIRCVHSDVVEPRPQTRDPGPCGGVVWEVQCSTRWRARSDADRVADAAGVLWCWGYNAQGQLGRGAALPFRRRPMQVALGCR